MKKLRDIAILLVTLYVMSYLCVTVPMHVAAFDCYDGGECSTQTFDHPGNRNAPDGDGHHDRHRCQICLPGGLNSALPNPTFSLSVELTETDRVEDGAMADPGVTLSHCRLSRAPPALA